MALAMTDRLSWVRSEDWPSKNNLGGLIEEHEEATDHKVRQSYDWGLCHGCSWKVVMGIAQGGSRDGFPRGAFLHAIYDDGSPDESEVMPSASHRPGETAGRPGRTARAPVVT